MKLTLLLIPLILLSSCTIDWNDEKITKIQDLNARVQQLEMQVILHKEKAPTILDRKDIGISFENFYGTGRFAINWDGNSWKIQFLSNEDDLGYYYPWDPLEILYRKNYEQKPEERIQELILEYGSNPDNCQIIREGPDEQGFDKFTIDLKNKGIKYTQAESQQLEIEKKFSDTTGGPESMFVKAEIYNKNLRKECGQYAIGTPPATSKTYGSSFLSSSGSITLLYHPSGADPSVIKYGTLKLTDPH